LVLGAAGSAGLFYVIAQATADVGIDSLGRLLVAEVAFVYLILAHHRGWPYPQASRQVAPWYTETHSSGFMYFGIAMGTGMRTYSPTVLPHALALGIWVSASLTAAIGAALGFAIGRTAAIPLNRHLLKARGGGHRFGFSAPLSLVLTLAVIGLGFATYS
jgi:hypothetical protein